MAEPKALVAALASQLGTFSVPEKDRTMVAVLPATLLAPSSACRPNCRSK